MLREEHPLISFQMPVSHGFIFPWELSTIGISVPVAQSMESALKSIWFREVDKFSEEFSRRPRKGIQGPPTRPIFEDPWDVLPDFSFEM